MISARHAALLATRRHLTLTMTRIAESGTRSINVIPAEAGCYGGRAVPARDPVTTQAVLLVTWTSPADRALRRDRVGSADRVRARRLRRRRRRVDRGARSRRHRRESGRV